jgi:hypothetical protein
MYMNEVPKQCGPLTIWQKKKAFHSGERKAYEYHFGAMIEIAGSRSSNLSMTDFTER